MVEGALDIQRASLGEAGEDLDDIQKAESRLKHTIREKARDLCLYATPGEMRDDATVGALYQLAATAGRVDTIYHPASAPGV